MTDLDEAAELAKAVERLRILYEQYFAGIERFEPLKERGKVKKELRRLMGTHSKNTAYRFRLQTLQATLVTHEQHWDRIARQIEEGTFKRDKLKAQRQAIAIRDATHEAELIEEEDVPRPITAESWDTVQQTRPTVPEPRNTTPQAPAPIPAKAAAPSARPADASVDIKQLHEALVAARNQTGEKLVSIETLTETIRKQTAAVKAQLGCANVEFKVAIKNGKAVLKAIPR